MGIALFCAIIDSLIKIFQYYQFSFPYLTFFLIVYSYTIYSYGFAYVFLPNTMFGKDLCMKIVSFWGIFALMFVMTYDIALQFQEYGGTDYCKPKNACTYHMFLHIFPPFMFNFVLNVILGVDAYLDNMLANQNKTDEIQYSDKSHTQNLLFEGPKDQEIEIRDNQAMVKAATKVNSSKEVNEESKNTMNDNKFDIMQSNIKHVDPEEKA